MSDDVVIAGYARSPFQPAGRGELARVRPDELAAQVVKALVEQCGVDPASLEDLILGCAFPEGEQGLNVARLVGFLAAGRLPGLEIHLVHACDLGGVCEQVSIPLGFRSV